MPPLILSDQIREQVSAYAAFKGIAQSWVWKLLWNKWDQLHDMNLEKVAYNAGFESRMAYLESMELIGDLSVIATELLQTPALPDTKKAPLPGSLFNEGDNT